MQKTVLENQAPCSSSLRFFRPSFMCIAVLPVLALVLTWFFSFSFFSPLLIAFSVLILSTVFFLVTFTRKKTVILHKNPAQSEDIINVENKVEMDVGEKLQIIMETDAEEKPTQQSKVVGEVDAQLENESCDESITSEDFEPSWMRTDHVGQTPATSDGSISGDSDDDDDENLIEIAIPGQQCVNLEEEEEEEEPKLKAESNLQQRGLMELLADINEMNEEENLIEIDISMGVFKV